jgi:hypothetical protein
MKHHLNYSKEDPNYILLEKIFKLSVLTSIRCEFAEHNSAILENLEQ